MADAPSLVEAIPGTLSALCESLDWDCGNVWMVDQDLNLLRHAAEWHRPDKRLAKFAETVAG